MEVSPERSVCIELHFLPTIPYLALIHKFRVLLIEQSENYQKRSFRNKTWIAAANGPLTLGIPLEKGKHQQQPIRETKISWDQPWQSRQWQSIRSAYGKAPYFEYYAPELSLLFEKKMTWLFDWNLALLEKIRQMLRMNFDITFTRDYQQELPSDIIDARNSITPQKIASTDDWRYKSPLYPQVFMEKHGFLPDLSILDLLFCQGPETTLLLESSLHFNP